MSKTTRCAVALCLSVFIAPAAYAQTQSQTETPPQTQTPTPPETPTPQPTTTPRPAPLPKFFVAGNIGYQMISETYDSTRTFEAYEETATLASGGELKSKPVYDASVGYLFSDDFGVSVGFSAYSQSEDIVVLAQVPHPIFFDQVRTASFEANDIKNTTTAININAVYMIPFTTQVNFSVSGGPSIVMVNQDVVTAATLQSENPPFSAPNISNITVTAQKKTTIGFNIGADAVYSITPRYGVGVTARYLLASADIEGLSDKLNVGGFQLLGGLRVKF